MNNDEQEKNEVSDELQKLNAEADQFLDDMEARLMEMDKDLLEAMIDNDKKIIEAGK